MAKLSIQDLTIKLEAYQQKLATFEQELAANDQSPDSEIQDLLASVKQLATTALEKISQQQQPQQPTAAASLPPALQQGLTKVATALAQLTEKTQQLQEQGHLAAKLPALQAHGQKITAAITTLETKLQQAPTTAQQEGQQQLETHQTALADLQQQWQAPSSTTTTEESATDSSSTATFQERVSQAKLDIQGIIERFAAFKAEYL